MDELQIKKYILGPIATNTYLCFDKKSKQSFLIDPAAPSKDILKFVESNELNVKAILFTHGHWDHISGALYFKQHFNCALRAHYEELSFFKNPKLNGSAFFGIDAEIPFPDKPFLEGDTLKIGKHTFEVIHVPGHSPGSILLISKKNRLLFSGDTCFKNGIGRTDLPGSCEDEIHSSIKNKVLCLPNILRFFPGHGSDDTLGNFKSFYQIYWG